MDIPTNGECKRPVMHATSLHHGIDSAQKEIRAIKKRRSESEGAVSWIFVTTIIKIQGTSDKAQERSKVQE
jgi:hypothetical protein